ncbi:tetratricopeptide repeat protein [Paenibacillus sp. JX-17]|uniref:Tetratricopeptide repeat protein n=1 Tax=Paenibacillus lacisoli TaxID=3064525 RepID=A0ABT9CGW7_9BACL|nr:tetratricopeptide repeat protein [Paenibacillus sp. JX-17]MDO7908511.1 tetratricopeptide repeat protein [Paenibacillus sp. JX-17]
MKGKDPRAADPSTNVVPIRLDASFFFERAVRSLDRNHYDKALKYFRKAVEYEPDNPVNHCNMAGILSEMGDYEASNAVLSSVLEKVDPSMTECYFYMANNYANMEQFEAAEEALVTYLEEDANGQFLEEAEEMMDLLFYELDRPAKLSRIKSRQGVVEHDQARLLLEEGKFAQAAKLLESIAEGSPEMYAARNNLALAYYYMGLFYKAKETINRLLEDDPGNLHALCNLAIFYQNEGNTEQLHELVEGLAVMVPFHQEHVFKLATTMGILGRHEEAYRHFRRLLKNEAHSSDPSLYHYTAAAANNTGRLDEAARLWKMVEKLDPASEIPRFYLSRMEQLEQDGSGIDMISYHYHLPFEEQFKLWEKFGSDMPDSLKNDPLVRSSFFWALRHGDYSTKVQVIKALAIIADYEVQEALQSFIADPLQEQDLKNQAAAVLEELGIEWQLPSSQSSMLPPAKPLVPSDSPAAAMNAKAKAVLDLAQNGKAKRLEPAQRQDLESIWLEYLRSTEDDQPMIHHVEGWAAALEYLTAKMHGIGVTYQDVAAAYGISVSTVSRYARQMDAVCNIKQRSQQMLPSFNEHL